MHSSLSLQPKATDINITFAAKISRQAFQAYCAAIHRAEQYFVRFTSLFDDVCAAQSGSLGSQTRLRILGTTDSVTAHFHRPSLFNRSSSCSCFLTNFYTTASYQPAVETKDSLGQKYCPTNLRLRSPYTPAK